jgi:hypothetical protein
MIDFKKDLHIRRFYWESMDDLPQINNNKCIFSGNIFYIIDKNNTTYNNQAPFGQLYLTSITSKKLIYAQEGNAQNLKNRDDENYTEYWLHRIVVDISTLDLPLHYYYSVANPAQRQAYIALSEEQKIKFAPARETYIFDQKLSLGTSPYINESFVEKLFDGTDRRFSDKYNFPNASVARRPFKTVFNQDNQSNAYDSTLQSFSSECSFIGEKSKLGYGILKINNQSVNFKQLTDMIVSTSIETIPNNCHIISTRFDKTAGDQNLWKPVFYNYSDFLLRPILLEKYKYLLDRINTNTYRFGVNRQYDMTKIRHDFHAITGTNAKIPIYNEEQIHWGGDKLEITTLTRGEQQMNRVGRIWQFLLNPIVVYNNNQLGFDRDDVAVRSLSYDPIPIVNGVVDVNGIPVITLTDLWNLIENILVSAIESIFNDALKKMDKNYILIGGKGLNNIIKQTKLKKSFDYDIHITDNTVPLINFKKKLCNFMNDNLNIFKQNRMYIANTLFQYNIISQEDFSHYKTKQLFYAGSRSRGLINIDGIFLSLKLRDSIFGTAVYSNYPQETRNFVYFNIADIDYENILNFGIPIVDNICHYQNKDINFPRYIYLAYNLIKYADSGSFKREKNLEKLKTLFSIDNYTCHFISSSASTDITNDLEHIKYLDTQALGGKARLARPLNIDGLNYTVGTLIIDVILQYLHDMITKERQNKLKSCKHSSTLHMGGYHQVDIFNPGVNSKTALQAFSDKIRVIDRNTTLNYAVKVYTTDAYKPINVYLQYTYLGIPISASNLYTSYGMVGHPDVDISYANVARYADKITENIARCNNSYDIAPSIRNDLKDFFNVWRLQTNIIINSPFNSPYDNFFSPDILKTGRTILYFPTFMSASYSSSFSYANFIDTADFLMNIKIYKSSKKWIIVDQYSNFPFEKEILIDKECIFLVTKIDYLPIETRFDTYTDRFTIFVTMFDDINDFNSKIDGELKGLASATPQAIIPGNPLLGFQNNKDIMEEYTTNLKILLKKQQRDLAKKSSTDKTLHIEKIYNEQENERNRLKEKIYDAHKEDLKNNEVEFELINFNTNMESKLKEKFSDKNNYTFKNKHVTFIDVTGQFDTGCDQILAKQKNLYVEKFYETYDNALSLQTHLMRDTHGTIDFSAQDKMISLTRLPDKLPVSRLLHRASRDMDEVVDRSDLQSNVGGGDKYYNIYNKNKHAYNYLL